MLLHCPPKHKRAIIRDILPVLERKHLQVPINMELRFKNSIKILNKLEHFFHSLFCFGLETK